METEIKVNTFAADVVKNLDIRASTATIRTKESATGEIRVEAKNLRDDIYICTVEAGTLVIAYRFKGIVHLHGFKQDETQITLYLPRNLTLKNAVLEIGAGVMYLDAVPVSCSRMRVEIGAGEWKTAQLSITDRLHVTIGAGKAQMRGVTAGTLHIECGVGSSLYEGRVNGDIKVDCSVGNCSFQLENEESDFNYDISCALGSIKINQNSIKSFASKKHYKHKTALGTVMLECGVGSIEIGTV